MFPRPVSTDDHRAALPAWSAYARAGLKSIPTAYLQAAVIAYCDPGLRVPNREETFAALSAELARREGNDSAARLAKGGRD